MFEDFLKPQNCVERVYIASIRVSLLFIKQSDQRSELKCVLFYFLLLFIHFHLLKILLSIYKIDKYNILKYFFNC